MVLFGPYLNFILYLCSEVMNNGVLKTEKY